ncbi:MAG: hypothetical protein IPP38_11105 [Bacteroidetes bacterium]|nr:hypothetical protein [Bacteroidota bacterium]
MIIIVDETFIDRHKYHEVSYLNDIKYANLCTVYTMVKTIDLASLVKQLSGCQLFCNHKTLQLFNAEGNALNIEDNSKNREALINKVTQLNIPRVEFSRGLETNYENKKIDKDLFYYNLKSLLDYFINNNSIEPKILFWGNSFKEKEKLDFIQKLMIEIRITELENFKTNRVIKYGLDFLYPKLTNEQVIDRWVKKKLNKNEIVKEINNQIQ